MKNFIILTSFIDTKPVRINVNKILYFNEKRQVPKDGAKPVTVGSNIFFNQADIPYPVKEFPEDIDMLVTSLQDDFLKGVINSYSKQLVDSVKQWL